MGYSTQYWKGTVTVLESCHDAANVVSSTTDLLIWQHLSMFLVYL